VVPSALQRSPIYKGLFEGSPLDLRHQQPLTVVDVALAVKKAATSAEYAALHHGAGGSKPMLMRVAERNLTGEYQ
jgi:hypothetical protein